jgi:hypothetical protein
VIALLFAGCAERADDPVGQEPAPEVTTTADALPAEPSLAGGLGLLAEADVDTLACVDQGLARARVRPRDLAQQPAPPEAVVAVFELAVTCLPGGTTHPILLEHLERRVEALLSWTVDIDADQAGCIMDGLPSDSLESARVLGPDLADQGDAAVDATLACLRPEQTGALLAFATETEMEVRDGRMDQLARGCIVDRHECDLLRLLGAPGWREFGATCDGAPTSPTGFCSVDVMVDATGYSPPDNPGLEVLEAACRDGRLVPCDVLRAIAPVGSDRLHLGATCGGRIPEGAQPDCRTAYADGVSDGFTG